MCPASCPTSIMTRNATSFRTRSIGVVIALRQRRSKHVYGFDQHTISVEVYVQAREIFTLSETLMNSAQQLRRLFLLKEINSRRMQIPLNSFPRRLRSQSRTRYYPPLQNQSNETSGS